MKRELYYLPIQYWSKKHVTETMTLPATGCKATTYGTEGPPQFKLVTHRPVV